MAQENKVDYSMKSGYDPPMNQQEWERDVKGQQRNVVSRSGRIAILVFAIGFFFIGCICLIGAISSFFYPHSKLYDEHILLTTFGTSGLLVGIGLAQRAFSFNSGAASKRHKRRHPSLDRS